ncbi:MAG: IS66 family insertion sequence element accessory protein TnpA, partial [Bdellovibrionia bacterium]
MGQDIKIETWKKRIQEAESHPVSVSAYCKEKNIPRSTFSSWRQKLKAPALGRSNPAKIGSFIQVD